MVPKAERVGGESSNRVGSGRNRGRYKVSGKRPTYSSPKLTLTLTSYLGQNDGLGEG